MGMSITAAKPDLQSHYDSVRLAPDEIIGALRETLGAKLTAYLGGVKETRAVREWMVAGGRSPADEVMVRLRASYQIMAMLGEHEAAATVASWFQGMNPELNDVAPARVLVEQELSVSVPAVLAAARSFVALG